MSDYGHDLLLGSFLTPQAAQPQRVVELAVLSERSGLDLVTFQDHPYQPAFLDTWTLLSWVAARTERVHLSGNVLNVPLRQPAVLARSVASLDLLSGGRVALGLGAGAFWDAIEAMGGPRMTGGEALTALEEAIAIVRGVWDADERSRLVVDGRFHRVDGAKRGPAPAHDVPIWVGAYKPRMLALVGRAGDGWLPSLGYLQLSDVAASNARIDAAAVEAGRDPREVRRLLNVGQGTFGGGSGFLQGRPQDWVEDLLPLVLEHGFSAFVLGSDDPGTIATFGQEVGPALREAVAAERAVAGTATGLVRSPAALALRSPGLDYEALPASLASRAVEPGDRAYERVRSTYVWHGSPALVVRAQDVEDVRATVAYARSQGVPLAVRSGGHGIAGRSTNDGGVVLDLAALDSVEVLDRERRLVRVGAGARWGDVAAALSPHGLAISSGDHGGVGVGGLVVNGGVGLLGRSFGLTLDRVVAAELVLADGRAVRVDAEHEPELFWAVRGAGASLGVLTAVEIEAAEVGDVVLAVFAYDAADGAGLVRRWSQQVEDSPRELTSFLTLVPGRGGAAPFAQAMTVWAGDDVDAAVAALEPFLGVGPVLQQQAQQLPYAAVVPAPASRHHHGGGDVVARGGLVEHAGGAVADVVQRLLEGGDAQMVQLRAMGGATADVAPDATAFAHRSARFAVSVTAPASRAARIDATWSGLRDEVVGVYRSFDTHADRLGLVYPPATLERLRAVKRAVDPDDVFGADLPLGEPDAALR